MAKKYIGFKKLVRKIASRKGVRNAKAIAAAIGRKKYGKRTFQRAAARGKTLRGYRKH